MSMRNVASTLYKKNAHTLLPMCANMKKAEMKAMSSCFETELITDTNNLCQGGIKVYVKNTRILLQF